MVIWMTGLSGSGKSTLAQELEPHLHEFNKSVITLDGDHVRKGINKDLGFSREDRKENIRRVAEIAKVLSQSGLVVIVAVICPYNEDRAMVNEILAEQELVNIYIKCSIQTCECRDPKGLYQKVRNDEIGQFTGSSAPFEEPRIVDLTIDTEKLSVEQCMQQILAYFIQRTLLV